MKANFNEELIGKAYKIVRDKKYSQEVNYLCGIQLAINDLCTNSKEDGVVEDATEFDKILRTKFLEIEALEKLLDEDVSDYTLLDNFVVDTHAILGGILKKEQLISDLKEIIDN